MTQQRLFICNSCGRDTLLQPHHHNCPIFSKEEVAQQSRDKARELGMDSDRRFGLPPLYGDP